MIVFFCKFYHDFSCKTLKYARTSTSKKLTFFSHVKEHTCNNKCLTDRKMCAKVANCIIISIII